LISEYYFPQSELALARESEGSTDGFYFTAWGGHNGGGHSHPDVGSCILYFDGNPVMIDIGRSSSRSVMHNVPFINGIAQTTGGIYKANNSKFSSSRKKVFFSTDIAGAYPQEAKVKKWNRSYKLERGKKFTIQDNFQLEQNLGNTKLHFMTELKGRITHPGILELSGNGFILNIRYNPSQLSATIEEKVLNDEISRLVFDLKTASLSGNILLEIFEVRSP